MICSHNNIGSVEIIQNISHQRTKLIDCFANGTEYVALCACLVANAVNGIVIDVHNLLASYGISTFFLFER